MKGLGFSINSTTLGINKLEYLQTRQVKVRIFISLITTEAE